MYVPDIRFCDAKDLPAVLELNAVSPWPWPDAVIREDLREDSTAEVTYIGAFSLSPTPRLLGYAALGRESGAGILLGLLVREEHRRRGIGAQLLAAAGECAAYLGLKRLRLRVRASNAPAIALYKGMAFVPEKMCRRYYSNGEDAILMGAALPLEGRERGGQ